MNALTLRSCHRKNFLIENIWAVESKNRADEFLRSFCWRFALLSVQEEHNKEGYGTRNTFFFSIALFSQVGENRAVPEQSTVEISRVLFRNCKTELIKKKSKFITMQRKRLWIRFLENFIEGVAILYTVVVPCKGHFLLASRFSWKKDCVIKDLREQCSLFKL